MRALLDVYLHRIPDELADDEAAKYAGPRIEALTFAWAGGIEASQPHYYRIQGPRLVVEYDNTQRNANHIHSVWRDLADDFGDDVLARHYRQAPLGHGHVECRVAVGCRCGWSWSRTSTRSLRAGAAWTRHNAGVAAGPQTLTFLFTDVEGSTRRWAADPEQMARHLARHDDVLRRAVAEHRGEVFKHTGDGICAVFGSAVDAARAAVAAQERLALPVRMGLHTGEAEQRDGDWYGSALNRAARIMDAGHGGQILCSAATAALLSDVVELRQMGEFRLKGLDREETIVQIGTGDFPPLRAGPTIVELPERRTALLGRDDLLARIDAALGEHRLVTLVGPGGVGKTSAAIEAARRRTGLVERIVFADLATVDDIDGVPAAIARALGVTVAGACCARARSGIDGRVDRRGQL